MNQFGFKFVDRNLFDRLVAFLDTENEHLTTSYKSLAADSALFLRLLKRYTNPFEQIQLRSILIQQRVSSGIAGSRFSVVSTGRETHALVGVPWIPSAFSVDEKAKDQVRLKFLREGIIDPEQDGPSCTRSLARRCVKPTVRRQFSPAKELL